MVELSAYDSRVQELSINTSTRLVDFKTGSQPDYLLFVTLSTKLPNKREDPFQPHHFTNLCYGGYTQTGLM